MATCQICFKRANRRHACFYCGRQPVCLKCVCPCRSEREKRLIVAGVLRALDDRDDDPEAPLGVDHRRPR